MAEANYSTFPKYRSHKTVGALKIKHLSEDGLLGTCLVSFEDKTFAPTVVSNALFARYRPVPGDYLVVYEDGYRSVSPAKAFEEGYTRLPGAPVAQGATREKIEAIAQVCHEANRTYCLTLGDVTQTAWHMAPLWQRDSAIKGVIFTMANPHATPADSHNSWLAEKRATGWKYGPVKDPDKKEHPCFVAYEELPAAQRAKDALFLATVRALTPTA